MDNFQLTPFWEAEDEVNSIFQRVMTMPEMTASHAGSYCYDNGEQLLEDEAKSVWADDYEVLSKEAQLKGRRIRY